MAGSGRGAVPGGQSGGFSFGGDGFGLSQLFGGGGGDGGGFSLAGLLGGNGGSNAIDLLGLGTNAYFGKQALDIEKDKFGLLKKNQKNAASAQNFSLANQLALQAATTTAGTPEAAQVAEAQANGTFQAV